MFLFKMFKRAPKPFTLADLAFALRTSLPYDVTLNDTNISIHVDGNIAALIEVENNEAMVWYEYTCEPYLAADLALVINDHMPCYASAQEFRATRIELESREGVH